MKNEQKFFEFWVDIIADMPSNISLYNNIYYYKFLKRQ